MATVGRGMVRVERFAGPPIGPPPFFERNPQYLADGVVLAEGGQVVLGDGEAVIDRDGTVLTGSTVSRDRVTVILTSVGEFQLLPGGLLLTPYGELLDLQALRSDPSTGGATSMPTVPTTPPSADGRARPDHPRRLSTVQRHPFDPVSAALGVLAVLAGLLVTLGEAADARHQRPVVARRRRGDRRPRR